MMSLYQQYPANFSEVYMWCHYSTTWDHGFTAQIGGIVREVEESFVGFIHLDWNTIEIAGSPPRWQVLRLSCFWWVSGPYG